MTFVPVFNFVQKIMSFLKNSVKEFLVVKEVHIKQIKCINDFMLNYMYIIWFWAMYNMVKYAYIRLSWDIYSGLDAIRLGFDIQSS